MANVEAIPRARDTVTLAERLIAPADALRFRIVRAMARAPVLAPVLTRRDARLTIQTASSVSVAFAATLLCPGVLFVVGPALFGVAHVAADFRYLVLRRALPAWWKATLAAGCLLLFACRAVEMAAPGRWPFARLEVSLGWMWVLSGVLAGAAAATTGETRRRATRRAVSAIAALAPVAIAAVLHPSVARTVFAHVHNLVAIGLWLALFRPRRRVAIPAGVLLAVFSFVLASGVALRWVHLEGLGTARFVGEAVFSWPGSVPQRIALDLGLLYVMLQSIHYAVWLAVVPQEDMRGQGTRTLRMSLRAATRDFGRPGAALIVALVGAVFVASLFASDRTRQLYLSLATFHGYLELAAGGFLWVRRR